jgi:hypothetical protein
MRQTREQCAKGIRCARSRGAAEQGDEADEAWSTSELRSLSPVFDGLKVER